MAETTARRFAPTLLRPVPRWAAALALIGLCLALAAAVNPFHRCVPRARANESAAIATLKNIATAQAQLRAGRALDADGDGHGEYGYLAELAGAATGRARLDPPLLSAKFGEVANGRVQRSGYVFACFLPGRSGAWLGEAAGGGPGTLPIDTDAAERAWRVLAWPAVPGSSGTRTFGIDSGGEVHATPPERAVFGGDRAPTPGVLDDPAFGWRVIR